LKQSRWYQVAGIRYCLEWDDADGELYSNPSYTQFEAAPGLADVTLRVHPGPGPAIPVGEEVFNSGAVWRLFQRPDGWAVRLSGQEGFTDFYGQAVFSPDFSSGEIYIRPGQSPDGRPLLMPLAFPMGELIMIQLLSQGRGVLMHACGVLDGEKGLLFSGVSGAGKSTSAKLWTRVGGARIVNDDRVVLRNVDGRIIMYGTPWHGEISTVLDARAALDRILVLRHEKENIARRLSPVDLTARLMVRCFPTFWDTAGMNYTLSFLEEVSRLVPGYDYGFIPDESAVRFVRGMQIR
jgi:hypothetical protein